jgi:hypothetical protein
MLCTCRQFFEEMRVLSRARATTLTVQIDTCIPRHAYIFDQEMISQPLQSSLTELVLNVTKSFTHIHGSIRLIEAIIDKSCLPKFQRLCIALDNRSGCLSGPEGFNFIQKYVQRKQHRRHLLTIDSAPDAAFAGTIVPHALNDTQDLLQRYRNHLIEYAATLRAKSGNTTSLSIELIYLARIEQPRGFAVIASDPHTLEKLY